MLRGRKPRDAQGEFVASTGRSQDHRVSQVSKATVSGQHTLQVIDTAAFFSPLRHFTFHIETHKESSSRVQRGVKNSRVSQHRVSQLYLLTWAKLLPAQKQLTCNSSQIAHFTLRCRGVICGEFVASTRRSQNSRVSQHRVSQLTWSKLLPAHKISDL